MSKEELKDWLEYERKRVEGWIDIAKDYYSQEYSAKESRLETIEEIIKMLTDD